ncbi:GNAT family N-acetyltransferase [Nonlabens sp. SY33080]|uniref:GNAT family N-acetyltransferase n=1 Tax=Nonlabens sp. SY33080 TaxID=2719911 RepID=UPI00142893C7|nr:GNAT family N-acetyltransferase [Nonlabens sp. SY33080]
MNSYKALTTQVFSTDKYRIVPIRIEDRYDIMRWRNEQIYHLRQNKPLTKRDQDDYFENVVSKLFDQEMPSQFLFSFLKNNVCVGYGGLVHINWIDKNAEISFIMDTKSEDIYFEKYWTIYLDLIEKLAFQELKIHKLYVYAFDLRPHLYKVLKKNDYYLDAILKEHCYFNNRYLDVVIHSKIDSK